MSTVTPLQEDPFWTRPIVDDPLLGLRRAFWNELEPLQKAREIEFHKVYRRRPTVVK